MKALLVLVLLSMVSTAQAATFRGKDLQCSNRSKDGTVLYTLNKTGKYAEVKASLDSQHVSTTRLYIKDSKQNMIFEMVHTGIAERQVQVDVFAKANFTLVEPNVISNGVTLILNDISSGEETDRVVFECVKPDNR